jgi:hypothetical protein
MILQVPVRLSIHQPFVAHLAHGGPVGLRNLGWTLAHLPLFETEMPNQVQPTVFMGARGLVIYEDEFEPASQPRAS